MCQPTNCAYELYLDTRSDVHWQCDFLWGVIRLFHDATTALGGPGLSHCRGFTITLSDTPHLVGLIGTSDGPPQRHLLDNTQNSQKTYMHASSGIRTLNPSNRAAVDQHLRPRGNRDRLSSLCSTTLGNYLRFRGSYVFIFVNLFNFYEVFFISLLGG
jgi:hypothetical protein